jgi:hypothetical protein
MNDFYSQCLQGAPTSTASGTTTFASGPAGGGAGSSSVGTQTSTVTASGGSATLMPGCSFVLAVVFNFGSSSLSTGTLDSVLTKTKR